MSLAGLPAGRVETDAEARALAAEDVSGPGAAVPAAVLRPETPAEVAAIVAAARAEGRAVVPRGGGLSYTGGIWAPDDRAWAVDLSGLSRIEAIDAEGRTATVEAGVTWAALHEALAGEGLRAPFFGPLSGLVATVGGALSQNGAFFGSAAHGYAAEAVTGLEVADGTGRLLRLGAWAAGRAPGLPWFGPGLVAPFLGDAGAFGVKTRAVLRLIPAPPGPRFASFAFDTAEGVTAAMAALRDVPHLAEVWAFDREAHRGLAKAGFSVLETAEMAAGVAKGGVLGAARRLAEAATMRRAVLSDLEWSLHVVIEPPLAALGEPVAAAVAEAALAAGGRAIPDTVPRVTRAKPFRTIKALVGPEGERWLPCHGVLPAARAGAGLAAVRRVLETRADEMAGEGVRVSTLLAAVVGEVIVEPQLHWPDALSRVQRARATPAQVAAHDRAEGRPAARALAHALRREMAEALAGAGAGHLQLGRGYPWAEALAPETRALAAALKRATDPDGVLNPGALGL